MDIYLLQKTFIGAEGNRLLVSGRVELFKGGRKVDIDLTRIYEVVEYVGHWRNFPDLHRWIVENVLPGASVGNEYPIDPLALPPLLRSCRAI